MVKFMVWAERTPGQECAPLVDEDVRDSTTEEIDAKYPVEAWHSESATGVQVGFERFAGSTPIWLWQA